MTEFDLVGPLQTAIARSDATWVSQPSHLRRRLVEELGPDARRYRAQIHQLVVAAEERVPTRIRRAGWSSESCAELGQLLVGARGWTSEAADWTVRTWAAALGLSSERPATSPRVDVPEPVRPPIVESTTAGTVVPTSLPDPADLPPPTTLSPSRLFAPPSRSQEVVGATALPSVLATSLPADVPSAPAPPAAPAELVTKGTKQLTRKAAALLGHDVDVAYEVKAGPSPIWLLVLALPIGLGVFVVPQPLGGVLPMAFTLTIIIGLVTWPTRVLAVRGGDVWLLSAKGGFRPRPTAIKAQGRRHEVQYAGGWPFRSVRFAGERLWFRRPPGAARRLPAAAPVEVAS